MTHSTWLATLALVLVPPPCEGDGQDWVRLFDGKTPAGWVIGGEPVPQANVWYRDIKVQRLK